MSDQLVITEKSSQAKDVRAAVGGRYGTVLAAEGHLLDLVEPQEANPAWARWTPVLLRPEGLYPTRPAKGGNKATRLKDIREALRTARCVWLATDCDREGQLIGQEILEHFKFRGEVRRVLFTAQDPETIRAAFARARPNREMAGLYDAAVARRQADQIYNLSLTRTATVTLARNQKVVLGVGRVKTPTLALVCRRELEIRNFKPINYFEVVATAVTEHGCFAMRHAPQERLLERARAEAVVAAAEGFEGPLKVKVETKNQAPPKLHDLPSLQKLCATRFGWSAAKTLEVAQELYDGSGKKIITYPRAEVRYLPTSLIAEVPASVAGLKGAPGLGDIPLPAEPVIRKGASGTFYDKAVESASHHAVVPNAKTVHALPEIWPRLSSDEKKLFDVIARAYLAALMPDFRYRQTSVTLDVRGFEFRTSGRQPLELGWRLAFPDWKPADEQGEGTGLLPTLRDGEPARLHEPRIEAKETRPPARYNEGTLIEAMQQAWRYVADETLRERLKEAKGIGTPATRAEVIAGLKKQHLLTVEQKNIVPTPAGLELFGILGKADPSLVDPGLTAQMELLLDEVVEGQQTLHTAIDAICAMAQRSIDRLVAQPGQISAEMLTRPTKGSKRAPSKTRGNYPRSRAAGEEAPSDSSAPPARSRRKTSGPKTSTSARARRKSSRGEGDEASPKPRRKPRGIASKPPKSPSKSSTPGSPEGTFKAPTKAPRKGAGHTASGPADPITPLRIPYGNKEVAMRLGARYSAGGWYAPPGVDLEPFRKQGWL